MVRCKQEASTERQRRFVEEYLVDLNATQAAIRAGYSEKTAAKQGMRLLQRPEIQAALSEAMKARAQRTGITADRVVRELARVAFGDPRAVMAWGPGGVTLKDSAELTDDAAALVAEVSETRTKDGGSIKAKLADKLKALEMLGRHLGMFVDRHELTGQNGAPIEQRVAESLDMSGLTDDELAKFQHLLDHAGGGGGGAS